jgi:hypothetical protein
MEATSGHVFWAADRLGKSRHARGGGGAARAAMGEWATNEAAEQTSTEGGEGKSGAGKEGSTRGDEEGDEGALDGGGGDDTGLLRASATWLLEPGVWRISEVNSEM